MYDVIFYEDRNGKSELRDYLTELEQSGDTDKNARVHRQKILADIQALSTHGFRLDSKIIKHLSGDIWELRPLDNRILFFYWTGKTFVLLHHFIKKSQKTPRREIERAVREMKDHIMRFGGRHGSQSI